MTRWNREAGWRRRSRELLSLSLSHGEHLSKALVESRTLPDAGNLLMGYYPMLLSILWVFINVTLLSISTPHQLKGAYWIKKMWHIYTQKYT